MLQFLIEKTGSLMGWCTIIFFGLAVSNYILKFINRKYGKSLRAHQSLGKYYNILFKSIIKYHKVFGSLTILFIGIHFIIFFSTKGLNIKGVFAALLMIFIILQGSYGSFIMKKRNKFWLYIHRSLAFVLILAIINHIL